MPTSEVKELILESKFEEVQKLESYLNDLQNWAGFDDEDYARIMLTLSEAATNAIVHGNKEKRGKKVTIRCICEQNQLVITVSDEGEGFSPEEVPDPLKKENLMNEGGRGVYLIEEYADGVDYLEDGSTIRMTFKLNAGSS